VLFDSIESLKKEGFVGFKTVAKLRENRSIIPRVRGIYMVLYLGEGRPKFVAKGTGGEFKGEDKNVAISLLESKWVSNTIVIYIGQAGGVLAGKWSEATLFDRVRRYIKYGEGRPVGHQGGCYIWQISGCEELVLCWKPLPNHISDPKQIEGELIKEFMSKYDGKMPFANNKL